MNFNYQNYVNRYSYQPYCWPPDLSLAELHARCSEPGPINEHGVRCPCCQNCSKRKIYKWWKQDIDEDLKQNGTAIPGYFQLIKYYSCFAVLVLLVNSIYPIYATYYACNNLDEKHNICLEVGAIYYLQFNSLVSLLKQYGRQDMVDILTILQTVVFYVLLIANYFSIVFITFLNDTAKRQIQLLRSTEASRSLVFYNITKQSYKNIQSLLKDESGSMNMNIVRSLQLFEIKKYFQNFKKRNKIYYHLLSLYVIAQNPLKIKNLNKQLKQYHSIVLQQKQKFNQFNHKVIVMFENVEACKNVNRIYKMQLFQKWWLGVRSLMNQFKIKSFNNQQIRLATYQIGFGSDILWQNLGEKLGVKMAIRIKTFFVAIIFIAICYIVLYYPMVFSLKAHIKAQTKKFVHLNTWQKILPNLTAFALVSLSIYFRIYMDRLSQQRNPKDQLQKARFVLITCLTFHILFYVIIPTLFFILPSEISETVKLYVISEQARTFIVVQVIIVLVDLPYRMWKKKKVKALSDQRIAFRSNQFMLHKIVQCRDYPLQIRLQVLFRIWSLVLFYSFFIPYMMFYIAVAFLIIFWIEKNNLYKHYTIRRKVSIKLQSQTLIYYVNFFCVYLCFVYCYTVREQPVKIIIAVTLTIAGLIANIVYWIVFNKGQDRTTQILLNNSANLNKQQVFLKKQKLEEVAQKFASSYQTFLDSIQNDQLDEEITNYLSKVRDYQQDRKSQRASKLIQMASIKSQQEIKTVQDQDDLQYHSVQLQDDQII